MIPFMENAKLLDILPLKDVISIHSDINYFYGDESYEDKIRIYTFLWDSLQSFIVNNKYIITEERNQLFYQYSPLFDFFNITIVTLKFDFSEDIPYEYIYSSNLHEVFQKLEMLFIEPSYYSHRKEIYIPPSDPHYSLLTRYTTSNCRAIVIFVFNDSLLFIHFPIMKHIKQLVTLQNPRVKIQFDIPPLLITIRDGLVDTIIIFNIFNFIQPGSYPEYIQLFKDIITTHVFPNVTTLKITYFSYDLYIPLFQEILQLITRNHFPKLHIYDISDIIRNEIHIYKENYKFVLFYESIIQLMDTIIYDKDILSDILENVVVYPEMSEAILNTNNSNYFTIQVNPDEDEEYEYDSDWEDYSDEDENIM
ncbi:hypothetical protein WA158_000626 [Blastocystis sp. Blastoise]